MRQLIQELYAKERESLISVWLLSGSLGEVLAERAALKKLQDTGVTLVTSLRGEVKELAQQREDLEQHQQDLGLLEQLLSDQQADLSYQEDEQAEFLDAKREEQVIHTQRIAEAEIARQEIEQDIYTLQVAGVNIKLTDATSMAQYASSLTGVRPALLLGMLKVESKLGASIGTGTFPDDMHPASREPFLRLTAKLGLDPKQAPISARPRSLRGWGGAMGPAQIMPQTWEGLEARIGQLIGKIVPNPYELADAFVGTAVLMKGFALRVKMHLNVTPQSVQFPAKWDDRITMQNFCHMRYNSRDSKTIRDWIYDDARLFLSRKRAKAFSLTTSYLAEIGTTDMAEILGVAKDFVKRHFDKVGAGTRSGRYRTFTQQDIEVWQNYVEKIRQSPRSRLPR